jgi:hypothetical protein
MSSALASLAGGRHAIVDALDHVPSSPGLYAIWAGETAWRALGLELPVADKPLYVGKAEKSLVSRDVNTHFMTGKTGQSTVRRTFAALLRDALDLHAVPRNQTRPERPVNFGLERKSDEALTEWMQRHLSLATWSKQGNDELDHVETAVLEHWQPPLNLSKVARPDPRIKRARSHMAADAKAWAKARGFDI